MVADAPGCEIALAWMFKTDTETYSHDGATAGHSSYALFNPKGDYAAIVLVNITLDNTAFANLLGEHVAGRLEGEAQSRCRTDPPGATSPQIPHAICIRTLIAG
jgi:hypothetical protein